MTTPPRSPEQRSKALKAAMAVRQERARLRKALHARELTAVDVLDGMPENPLWGSLKVTWLLECLPGVGTIRAERIMATLHIAPSRRLQGLGVRQRAALIDQLAGR
jgi:hypothetical protein